MPSAEDLAANRLAIEAFFEDLEQKALFTDSLYQDGHKDEAQLLCCCYIEACGNGLAATSTVGAECFTKVLTDHGEEPVLELIHPRAIQESLPYKSTSPASKSSLEGALQKLPTNEVLTSGELLVTMQPLVSPEAFEFLKRELWRGSIASIVYSRIRSPGVHRFGRQKNLIFSGTAYNGEPIPEIDFPILRRALDRVIEHAKQVSLSSNSWFGHP